MSRCVVKKKGIQCSKTAIRGSLFCYIHLVQRIGRYVASFSVIGSIALLVLGHIANIASILDFLGIKPLIVLSPSAIALPYPGVNVELITTNGQRIQVETDNREIISYDTIKIHEMITVTFRVLNNGISPVTIKSLVIGSRGPGVSCEEENQQKWTAPNIPFPTIRNIILEPGQDYEYRGSRAFYKPGRYFFEPVIQDILGRWGGIPPFTCVDISVTEDEPLLVK